jgi:hypothetical protein
VRNAHAKETERKQNCGEDARKLSLRNMWVNSVEDYRPGLFMTRLREGAAVRPIELFSRATREMKKSAASILEVTSDVAGALRHAPACVSTFSHMTTSAHMPATHNTPHMDACQQAGDCIVNPMPGFEYRPTAQLADVTSSIILNHAEDDDLLDRRGGHHYESCEKTAVSGTALVTTPATEECHRKPVKNCQQGGCP